MADIELIIKMPEKDWKFLKESNGCRWSKTIIEAVINGTPLPKGHGRIIDVNSVYQIVRPIEPSDSEWGMTAETAKQLIHDVFKQAPTIIEADKVESKE